MYKDNWETKYELAKQYYKENGNLLIPSQYVINDIQLGSWISHQRKYHKENKLSKGKIDLLEKIGMVWSALDAQWYEYYNVAAKYYNENGDLLVPLKYSINNCNLGYWIGTQRRNYKQHKLSKERIDLLEKIGMVWSTYDSQWYEYYYELVEYYNKNGDSFVPLRYVTKRNRQLGAWISHQRINYNSKKLSKEKIDLLEKVGMVWNPTEKIWNDTYEIAKQYFNDNQNLNIPNEFFYKSVSLGSWILTQRNNYNQKRLTDKQIELLNAIGMEWDPIRNLEYIWEKNYNTVLEFYKKYKHLYIPISYVTEDGVKIGVWLYDQGLKYKKNEISKERRKKLDLLDKSWLEPINTKSSFPEQAVLFYVKKSFPSATKYKSKEISEIDIFIPELKIGIEYDGPAHIRTKKGDTEKSETCKKQGIVLIRIRDCKCPIIEDESYKIILKNDSFEALEDGIKELFKLLNVSNGDINIERDYIEISDKYIKSIDLDWYIKYEKIKDYYNEYGNINVPISYKTPDGFLLGHWLSNIRNSFKNPNSQGMRLNTNKIRLLEELGIDWSPIETQWKISYDLAAEYYNENGNLLIPDKYVTNEGIKLGRWIATQRSNYKENTLPKEKAKLLEDIGMIWDVNDYKWMKMFDLAKKYFNENGDLLIVDSYKKDGVSLGSWIGKQRKYYKEHSLAKERVALLEKIGMVWNL